MRKLAFDTVLGAALILLGPAAIDQAAARTESFRRSCHEIRISHQNGLEMIDALCDDGRTTAQFEGFQSVENHFAVPLFGCRDIENRRGLLVCVGPGKDDRKAAGARLPAGEIPYGLSLVPPGGSWRASCRGGRFEQGSIFYAVCRTAFGGSANGSSINVTTCPRRQLKNINGRLRCE